MLNPLVLFIVDVRLGRSLLEADFVWVVDFVCFDLINNEDAGRV